MNDQPENAVLVITVLDTDDTDTFTVELWTRGGMSRQELVARLRQIADDFEHDNVRRVR
jgi:hypothetical protein